MTSTIAAPDTDTAERDFPFRSSISTQPAPMTVSKDSNTPTKASLDLLISNDGFSHIDIESLTITFTVADDNWGQDASGILTPVWNKVSRPKPELPPGWAEDTSSPEPGQFTFKPENKKVKPNDALRLHLDDIHVSAIEGITDVVVSVEVPDGQPEFKDATHSIGKFPIGFEMKDFRADDPIVENGQSTKLNWKVGGDDNVVYNFFVNGVEKELRSGRIEPPFDTGPLHATTVYKITAKQQVGGDWLLYSDSTVVHVHGGEITAANALIAGLRPALLKTLLSYHSFEVIGAGTEESKYRCTGSADGLIVGELKITGEGKAEAELAVRLTCEGFPPVEAKAPAGGNDLYFGQYIIMPLPGGEVCEVQVKAKNVETTTGWVNLHWVSLSGDNRSPKCEQVPV
ncbi:hypothetical protein [Actinomadura verrucosospora]|uniref:Uncharacterized protein n=1 Tax=Actinomadura verrucosospora TaxID=46165 RepID=A0A7D4A7V7_ACTVE|nr:hypothetical protein [Actinomadura verrucosospora]QKG27264.1 hypothetical protein ACTIVE_8917 [Actinomadura verrucosospora]